MQFMMMMLARLDRIYDQMRTAKVHRVVLQLEEIAMMMAHPRRVL
jgi:hypothetical protein